MDAMADWSDAALLEEYLRTKSDPALVKALEGFISLGFETNGGDDKLEISRNGKKLELLNGFLPNKLTYPIFVFENSPIIKAEDFKAIAQGK